MYNNQLIYVMADDDDDPSVIQQYGSLNDIAPLPNVVEPLLVYSFDITNEYIRQSNTYRFFARSGNAINANQYFFVDFPIKILVPPKECRIISDVFPLDG